jgi:CRISPR-associated protein Cas2
MSTPVRRRYVVTYDIAADRRRDRVHRALTDFGDWVQFSVFICDLNERERIQLRARLDPIINHREDQILTIDIGPSDRDRDQTISTLGRGFCLPGRTIVV